MSRRRGEAPEGWPVLLAPWQYRDHDPAKDHQPKTDRHITRWQRMASEWIEEHIHDRRARSTARAIVIEAPTFLNDGESLANGEPALSFTIRQMAERIGKSTDATAARLQKMCEPGGPLAIVWQGRAKWPTVYALAMASHADHDAPTARQEGAAPPALPQRARRATAAAQAGPSKATGKPMATGNGDGPMVAQAGNVATQAGPVAFDPNACLDTFTRGEALNQAWAEFCESARTMATPESQQVYAAGVIMGFTRDVPPVAILTDRGAA